MNAEIKGEIDNILSESTIPGRVNFLEYIGLNSSFEYQDKRFADENRFVKLLEKFANDKKEVQISSYSSVYPFLANNASRNGMSLSDFIASHGFTYVSFRDTSAQQNAINNKLYQRSLGGKYVYIDPFDPLYASLTAAAYRNKKRLSTFLEEKYGYKRVLLKDINENVALYDWTVELEVFDEEKVRSYIITFLDEDNILRITAGAEVYKQLSIYAKSAKLKPTEVLKNWGIEHKFIVSNTNKKNQIEDILEELEHLSSQIAKTTITSEKLSRNKVMVDKLKLLYNVQCQICSEEERIPLIESQSGRNYVEVHHIHPMNGFDGEKSVNDESNLLIDHYKNCLVVCPHHHKFIHFYKDGFKNKSDDDRYLFTDSGEKLMLHLNYHIT
ncbi:HNH endonuclease signature motif containing protein [Desemzia incerta]|uniref:HNH endonuclease signature motif containing protein n=1 Tax=Desemzia incerta TaxID=82801 RepID=UPI003D045B20